MTNPTQSTGGVEVATEWAHLSWSGFNLQGDPESIKEARRALHEADTVPELKDRICAAESALASARESEERLAEALRAHVAAHPIPSTACITQRAAYEAARQALAAHEAKSGRVG